jgi:phage terminase small subunit/transposase-like protein
MSVRYSAADKKKVIQTLQRSGGLTADGIAAVRRLELHIATLSKSTIRRWWSRHQHDGGAPPAKRNKRKQDSAKWTDRASANKVSEIADDDPLAFPVYDGLTPKQRVFVAVYLRTLNATEAAMQAYQTTDRVVAASIGYQNLRKLNVRTIIDAELDARTLTKSEILFRLTEIAIGSIEDVADLRDDGTWQVNLTKAHLRGKLHLIHKLTEKRNTDGDGNTESTFAVELYDAHAALRDLGRHRQLFNEKIELAIPKEVAELLGKYNISMSQFFAVFQKLLERKVIAHA